MCRGRASMGTLYLRFDFAVNLFVLRNKVY